MSTGRRERNEESKQALFKLLCSRSVYERACDEVAEHNEPSEQLEPMEVRKVTDACIKAVSMRCNNWDMGRTCGVINLHERKEDIVSHTHLDVCGYLLDRGVQQCNESRWTKQLPALRQWCAHSCLPGCVRTWQTVHFACENANASGNDRRNLQSKKRTAGRKWMGNDKFAFQQVLVFSLCESLEPMSETLFESSPVGWGKTVKFSVHAGVSAVPQPDRRQKTIADVIDSSESIVCTLWNTFAGRSDPKDACWWLACEVWPEHLSKTFMWCEVFRTLFCISLGKWYVGSIYDSGIRRIASAQPRVARRLHDVRLIRLQQAQCFAVPIIWKNWDSSSETVEEQHTHEHMKQSKHSCPGANQLRCQRSEAILISSTQPTWTRGVQ